MKTQELFFTNMQKFTACINHQIREKTTQARARIKRHMCACTYTHMCDTHTRIPLFLKFTQASSSKNFVSSLLRKLGERKNVCKNSIWASWVEPYVWLTNNDFKI